MPQFGDLDNVIARAKDSGVGCIINASFDLDSSKKSVELSNKYENMYACVGIHPHNAAEMNDAAIKELKLLIKDKKVIAVGETGLDYYNNEVPEDVQKKAFLEHIKLSKQYGLPLVLHGRNAPDQMLDILKREATGRKAVFHCFSEDTDYAKKVIDLGFLISFTAVITFKNAAMLREVVKYAPLEKIMIETDCPYLAPQKYRGQRNEPAYVACVAEKIAEIKGISIEEVAEKTTETALSFFGIRNTVEIQ